MAGDKITEIFKVEDPYSLQYDNNCGLRVIHNFSWEDHYYIGMVLSGEEEHCEMTSQMRDDETKEQFRERVQKSLSALADQEVECSFHSASWYNG